MHTHSIVLHRKRWHPRKVITMLGSCTENMNQLRSEGINMKYQGQQVTQDSDQQRPGTKCEYTTAVIYYMAVIFSSYTFKFNLNLNPDLFVLLTNPMQGTKPTLCRWLNIF